MSSSTINSFPPLHSFDSSRSWFLAAIVLLHLGFFWALSAGLSIREIFLPPPATEVSFVDEKKTIDPDQVEPVTPDPLRLEPLVIPRPDIPLGSTEKSVEGTTEATRDPPPAGKSGSSAVPEPVVVWPSLDYSRFREPVYPVSERRAGHEGTVVLLVEVLPNGRVGEVKLMQSSGYAKLDDSALREARAWRFKPGTRDGVPISMWKQVPVKFELKNEVAF